MSGHVHQHSACKRAFVRLHMYTHVYTCIPIYTHVCKCMHMYAYTCIHMYAHLCTFMHMYTHVCTCVYMHTHVCTCIHTSVHSRLLTLSRNCHTDMGLLVALYGPTREARAPCYAPVNVHLEAHASTSSRRTGIPTALSGSGG